MVQSLRWLSLLIFANALFACPFAKGFGRRSDKDTDNATSNAGVYGDASVRGDACPPDHKETMAAKPTGCAMTEQCNDGLDNDCNGKVDEGCPCSPGQVQQCFLGPPG